MDVLIDLNKETVSEMSLLVDGILLVIIVLSIILNGIINTALIKKWKKLKTLDVVLLSLTICDFCQAIIGYPLEIGSILQGNNVQCIIAAYSTSTLALVSICILTSMSFAPIAQKKNNNAVSDILPAVIESYTWATRLAKLQAYPLPNYCSTASSAPLEADL